MIGGTVGLVALVSIFHHAFGLSARLEVVETLVVQALARIQMIRTLQGARRSPVILTIPMTMTITLRRKIHKAHRARLLRRKIHRARRARKYRALLPRLAGQ